MANAIDITWEGFLEEVCTESSKFGSVHGCSVGRYLDTLDDYARQLVEAAFDHPKVSNPMLHKALRSRGFDKSLTVVKVHKRRECSCYREGSK